MLSTFDALGASQRFTVHTSAELGVGIVACCDVGGVGALLEVSGVLVARGVGKGDVVVIYMPMIPEAQIAMLACARIGAVHCVGG